MVAAYSINEPMVHPLALLRVALDRPRDSFSFGDCDPWPRGSSGGEDGVFGREDEQAAWRKPLRDTRNERRVVANVMQRQRRNDQIERLGRERDILHRLESVGYARMRPLRPRHLDHPRRRIDPDDFHRPGACEEQGELSAPAAQVERAAPRHVTQ